MKGDSNVLKQLNEILVSELTAINQFFLHAKMCKNWGYESLYKKAYKKSIEAMKHADALSERILFLEGLPNFQKLNKLNIGQSVKEQLESDLAMEIGTVDCLKEGIKICLSAKDHVTREFLEGILVDEEEHIDWIEAQLGLIKEVSLAGYLAEKI